LITLNEIKKRKGTSQLFDNLRTGELVRAARIAVSALKLFNCLHFFLFDYFIRFSLWEI